MSCTNPMVSTMPMTPPPAPILTERDLTSKDEDPTMANLKNQVAAQGYDVNSALVAEEILLRLRLIKRVRHELVSGPGRTPQPKLRGL
jgi:hypothetical protein